MQKYKYLLFISFITILVCITGCGSDTDSKSETDSKIETTIATSITTNLTTTTTATEKMNEAYNAKVIFDEISNLSTSNCRKGALGMYTYNELTISDNDVTSNGRIKAWAFYKYLSRCLEQFRLGNSWNVYAPHIIGYLPETKDEFASMVKDHSEFIVSDDSAANTVAALYKRASKTSSAETDIDEHDKYSIKITDISKFLKELNISEEMLAYIAGFFYETGKHSFDVENNTCTFEYYDTEHKIGLKKEKAIPKVEEFYNSIRHVEKSDLDSNNCYNGIKVYNHDMNDWGDGIDHRAFYFSLAKSLDQYYIKNEWQYYIKHIIGYIPDSKDECTALIPKLDEFIAYEDTSNFLTVVLQKFKSLDSVDFNEDDHVYTIVFKDLSKCLDELGISDEMLAYMFGAIDEFAGFDSLNFDSENSCTLKINDTFNDKHHVDFKSEEEVEETRNTNLSAFTEYKKSFLADVTLSKQLGSISKEYEFTDVYSDDRLYVFKTKVGYEECYIEAISNSVNPINEIVITQPALKDYQEAESKDLIRFLVYAINNLLRKSSDYNYTNQEIYDIVSDAISCSDNSTEFKNDALDIEIEYTKDFKSKIFDIMLK